MVGVATTRGGGRFVRNPAMFRELAQSDGVRDLLAERAAVGAATAAATVRSYSGRTWKRGVTRTSEYARMTFSDVVLTPSGWRSRFGSDAPWTLQVEYGTGRRRRRRVRRLILTKPPRPASSRVSLTKGGAAPSRRRRRRRRSRRRYEYSVIHRRPQKGHSPRQRVLYKSLRALRRL